MALIQDVIEKIREHLLEDRRRIVRLETLAEAWASHTHTVRDPREPVGINDVAVSFEDTPLWTDDVSRETRDG